MSEKTIRFINIPDNLKIDANTHSFNTSLAEAVGLVEAILLQNFFYWHNCNEGNKDMTKEGRVWFFRSVKQISEEYKYLSVNKVRDAIERLVYSGLVIKGDFNEDKVQRASWYSLSDKVLEIFGKSQAICENHKPFVKITNINYNKETITINKEKEELHSSKKKETKFDVREDLSYVDEEFKNIWNEWLDYKDEAKIQYNTQRGAIQAYSTLKNYSDNNPVYANAIVKKSIECSWRGFFALSDKQKEFFNSDKSPYKDMQPKREKGFDINRMPKLEDFDYDKFAYRQALAVYNLEHGIK